MVITSESTLVKGFSDSELSIIPKEYRLMPILSFPWNPQSDAEEQSFFWVIHTMKKNIL